MAEWIRSDDRLPDSKDPVIVYVDTKIRKGIFDIKAQFIALGSCDVTLPACDPLWTVMLDGDELGFSNNSVRYWSPLPDPPVEE